MPRTSVSNRFLSRDMGKSISLNGTSDRFTLPLTPSTTAFSFGFWVNPSTLTSAARLVDYADGGPSGGFTVQVNVAQPTPRLEYVIYNLTTQQANLFSPGLSIGKWVHIGCTYSSNNAKLYLNGVNIATDTSCTMTAPTQTLSVCRRSNGSSNFFGANIDDLMFVNGRQISDAEMQTHYLAGQTPSDTTCVLDFNDNVIDQTGNSNNATLTGTSYSTNVPLARRSLPTKPRQMVGELAYNGDSEYIPPFTAATNTSLRWIDGTASGSSTDRRYGWYLFDVSPSASARFDTTEFYAGSGSLKLSLTDSSGRFAQVFNQSSPFRSIPVLPLTAYTLRYRMKTNRTSGSATGAYAAISERSGTGTNVLDTLGTAVNTTTSWTEYTVSVTTAATTRFIMIKLVNLGSGGAANLVMDAWFDNVSLTPNDGSSSRINL